MESLQEKVEKWLAPKMEMEELFMVEVIIGANYKIKVFIDSDDNKLTIRQCVRVSRHLEEFLDVIVLIITLSIVTWFVHKKRSQQRMLKSRS